MKHKINIKISLLLTFLFVVILETTLNAQNKTPNIKGVVHNEFGKPLSGAVVNSEFGKNSAFTDERGEYAIIVTDGSKFLQFSFLGYTNQRTNLGESGVIDANLKPDVSKKDEVIRLGYSSTTRNELTGSVSTVTGEELRKSPVANFSMSLDGRLPGLVTIEGSSEPGRAQTWLYARGQTGTPLAVIDGIPTKFNPIGTMDYLTPDEIESVTLLKDASAEALYGIEGSKGILIITTKRGKQGKLQIHTRFDESIQQVTTKPTFINSAKFAILKNEACSNDGSAKPYSDQDIANFQAGKDLNSYPNTNWYNLFMNKYAQMQRLNIDLQGGSDRLQYYTNVNVMNQGSQFKVADAAYNSNEHFLWVNFRSNVNAKITDYLGASLDLAGNIKNERSPGVFEFSQSIYNKLFGIPSTVYGPVTPENQVIATNLSESPYGDLNRSGYTNDVVTNVYAHFNLDLDMSFLTKGLKASGIVGYQTNTVDGLCDTQDYERWVPSSDNLTFTQKGLNTNSTLSYSKNASFYYYLTYKALMNYDREFGLNHVTGMGYMFYQNLRTNDTSSPNLLPYKRLHYGLEGTYAYDQKYILKFDMGYSGSEAYPRGNRFTTTPAVSAAWVASRESFLHDIQWLSNLKFKASYGKTASDDGIGRYAYLDNSIFGSSLNYLQYIINEGAIGNPGIRPEITTKQNYGIDFGILNTFSFGIDVFKENCNNMLINATINIPAYQGVPLGYYPQTNNGKIERQGYDFTAEFKKAIDKDLTVSLGGFVSYAANKVVYSGEPLLAGGADGYVYRQHIDGYPVGQSWGYLVDYSKNGNGFFNSSEELTSSALTYSSGTPRVGDLKYKDLNGDHIIDSKDLAPLGTGSLPRYYYGISGGLTYKAFVLSFLFQGVGEYQTIQSGLGIYGNSYDGVYGSLLENAWTADRYASGAKITAPALTATTTTSLTASDYYLYNNSYIRLKNLEIGYTLPSKVSEAISAEKIRFILSGQNLFTWDKMKSSDFGPEGSYGSIPVYRVFNVGLSLTF